LIRQLKNLSKEELLRKKSELEFLLMGARKGTRPLTDISNRRKIKREVARINFLLGGMK
jgi:hypothetical protein